MAATPGGDSTTAPGDSTMLELLVGLTGRLDLDSVAEAIETPRQLQTVRDSGCTYGQGYLLGQPQPPAKLPRTPAVSPP